MFLEATPSYTTRASEQLLEALYEERTRALDRALSLLELIHRGDDYATVRRSVVHGDVAKRAQAIELLGNIAPVELRGRLFALCTDEPRLTGDTTEVGPPKGSELKAFQSLLGEMQSHGSEAVRLLATRAREEHPAFAPSLRGRSMESWDSALPPAEAILWLRKVPLFTHLEPRVLAVLAAHVEDRHYPPDAAISGARAGETPLVVLLSGMVEAADRVLHGEGAVLNEASLFLEESAPLLVARSEVRALELRSSVLVDLMREHFEIFLAVAKRLAADALAMPVEEYLPPTDRGVADHDGIVERMDLLRAAMPFFEQHASSCAQLANACAHERREPGAPLLGEEPVCRSVGVVTRGDADDLDHDLSLGPGALVGLLEALVELPTPAVKARRELEMLRVSADDLLDVLEEHAVLQPTFLRFLATWSSAARRGAAELAA
jgi:CRP-like cAMP-binding protein